MHSRLGESCASSPIAPYLDVAATWHVLDVVLGTDFRLGFVLEVQLDRFDLLGAATGLMTGVVQRTYFRFGVPLQLHLRNLTTKK